MPDEPRSYRAAPGDPNRRGNRHSSEQQATGRHGVPEDPPEPARRRRSLEDAGGVTVSDLMRKTTGYAFPVSASDAEQAEQQWPAEQESPPPRRARQQPRWPASEAGANGVAPRSGAGQPPKHGQREDPGVTGPAGNGNGAGPWPQATPPQATPSQAPPPRPSQAESQRRRPPQAEPPGAPAEHAWPTSSGTHPPVDPPGAQQPPRRGGAPRTPRTPARPGTPAAGPTRHSTPPPAEPPPAAQQPSQPLPQPPQASQPPQAPQPPPQAPQPPAQQAPQPPPQRESSAHTQRVRPVNRPAPERPEQVDPVLLTDEMEPVGEVVQRRRRVDDTLARFSAVHEEMAEEERRRRGRRSKILPWVNDGDELDKALDPETVLVRKEGTKPATEPADETTLLGAEKPDAQPSEGDEQLSRLQEKKRRRQRRLTQAGKITAMALAILVFVVTGAAWGAKVWLNAKITEIAALDEDSASIKNAAAQSGDQNFLLVGSDTRAGRSGNAKVGTADQVQGARSDTVMVAHIPANRERVVMVSFPRDLEVNRPACQRWDSKSGEYSEQMAPASSTAKLNSVYSEGGPKCMVKVIQQISGLRINHFTGIDFSGFKDMVDAVRGVEVCVNEPIKDAILGTVIGRPGKQTISGDTALNYVRARHVIGDPTADYGRIERQQRFLSSLLRKALSQDVLLNPGRLNEFVSAVARATYGENMDVDQLLLLAQSLQDLSSGKVTFVTVPTVGYANDRGNEVLRSDDTNELFKAIIDNSPLPGEKPDANQAGPKPQAQPLAATPDAVSPQDIKIQVLNAGNTEDGIARNTANALTEQGFQVVQTENAAEQVDQTVIRYSDSSAAKARTLAKSVPGAKLERDPSVAGAVILLLGPDFDGNVTDGSGASGPPDVSTVNAADDSCS